MFEHSKKLLTNLVVVLACHDDKVAAAQARMVQRELSLRSPSTSSLLHIDEGTCPGRESIMMSSESLDSIIDEVPEENGLTAEARDLIEFVSKWYVLLLYSSVFSMLFVMSVMDAFQCPASYSILSLCDLLTAVTSTVNFHFLSPAHSIIIPAVITSLHPGHMLKSPASPTAVAVFPTWRTFWAEC